MTNQQLLSQLVSDFEVLYRAYARAGLLAEEVHTETAQKLLGSGDDVYRFTRTFLLADALIRNRVGRLVHGGGLRHLAVFGGNNVGKSTVVNLLEPAQMEVRAKEQWAAAVEAAVQLYRNPLLRIAHAAMQKTGTLDKSWR